MKKLLREPLVHFIILGAVLFIGHGFWLKTYGNPDLIIDISTEELERQAVIFAGENRREPTDEDLQSLLFSYVEEQALMREAERLGLGEDDTIIRRRLAQKMRFMIEDVQSPALPDDAVLKAWFEERKDRFVTPEKRAFTHIYLSPQTRGDRLDADAVKLLGTVTIENWKTLGDPFMMKRDFEALSSNEIERLFGDTFANDLFALKTDDTSVWQGPIGSAFGLHIINVKSVEPKKIPSFEEVKGPVSAAWLDETRRQKNTVRLKKLINKYKVTVEGEAL